jgi:putative copper resistance protein D
VWTTPLAHAAAGDDVLDGLVLVAVVVAATGYAGAVVVLHRRGGHWPVGRSVAAGTAALAVIAAGHGWIGAHELTHFSAHALQHVLLALVAPIAVVLSAPLTLGLRVGTPATRRRLRAVSGAAPLRVLTHPLVVGPLFVATMVAMYFTPLFAWSLESAWVHTAVHAHLVVVGLLLFWPLIGADPAPVRVPHPLRVGILLLVLPLHALIAVALFDTTRPVGGSTMVHLALEAGVDPARQQRIGAGVLWGAGDLVAFVAVVVAVWRWWKAETASDGYVAAPDVGSLV